MWCCRWDGKVRLNPGREPVCTRVSMEVMPCVIRVSAISKAVDWVDRMMS